MQMEFSQSRTAQNLMAAFSGEAMAWTKYDLYAGAARKEGYQQIARVFEETGKNERAHANVWFQLLGKLNGTAQNLQDALSGEHYEWSDMYARFAKEARDEGYDRIAALFSLVGGVEKRHEQRYQSYLDAINRGESFANPKPASWLCLNCGYLHEGPEAPQSCPLCEYPQSYFRLCGGAQG